MAAAGLVIVLQHCPCVDVDGVGYVLPIENNIYNIQFYETNQLLSILIINCVT